MDRYAVFHVDNRAGIYLFIERARNVARWAWVSYHDTTPEAEKRCAELNEEWSRQHALRNPV